MLNDNYLMVNGVKIELTEEQIKKLADDVEKSKKVVEVNNDKVMFSRVDMDEQYYRIDSYNRVNSIKEGLCNYDDELYNLGNYCREKQPLERKAVLMELVSKMYNHIWVTGGKELLCGKIEFRKWIYAVSYNRGYGTIGVEKYRNYTELLSFPTEESAQSFIVNNRELLYKWFMI